MRLARKCSLRWTPKFHVAAAGAHRGLEIAQGLHRHMMCLYGEDEKIIRLAAMDLGLTISAFVRMALELYLHTLAMEKRSRRTVTDLQLTHEGIRLTEFVQIFAENGGGWPAMRNLSCIHFDLDSYW